MEYFESVELATVIGKQTGPIPHNRAVPIFKQILDGIGHGHSRGIIHRDIKPANIVVAVEFHQRSAAHIDCTHGPGESTKSPQFGTLFIDDHVFVGEFLLQIPDLFEHHERVIHRPKGNSFARIGEKATSDNR